MQYVHIFAYIALNMLLQVPPAAPNPNHCIVLVFFLKEIILFFLLQTKKFARAN